ncbi:hypothetical protein ACHAXS_001067 [Conticribra weissflogii]
MDSSQRIIWWKEELGVVVCQEQYLYKRKGRGLLFGGVCVGKGLGNEHGSGAQTLLQTIHYKVHAITGLTCLASLASDPLLAKITSNIHKPNRQCFIGPSQCESCTAACPERTFLIKHDNNFSSSFFHSTSWCLIAMLRKN